MNRIFEAKITWLSAAHGGRKTCLPFGDSYFPLIRITKPFSDSYNSVKVFVKRGISYATYDHDADVETLCDMQYLLDGAPDNLLVGIEFDICEGKKVVGRGVILKERYKDIWEACRD